jgi:amidophosphoribosyltransferase
MGLNELIAVRDGYGIRPLSFGMYENNHYVFSSETCAINTVQADLVRDVKPGEMIVVSSGGMQSFQIVPGVQRLDVFEYIYFARPDSYLLGKRVNMVRQSLGRALYEIHPVDADVVIPVPDSAIPAAEGYSEASGIPLRHAFAKNRYVQRTFITPGERLRHSLSDMKYNIISEDVLDKRVVLMDDSIVRLTTAPRLVKRIRDAGAKEVHLMISSAPIRFPDFYGIDLPKQKDLGAAYHSIADIQKTVGADSLTYLPYESMIDAIGVPESQLYTGCFTGDYPIDLGERWDEVDLEVQKRLSDVGGVVVQKEKKTGGGRVVKYGATYIRNKNH